MNEKKKILYVEDSADNQLLISLFLRQEPVDFHTADDIEQALEKAADGGYDLFIIDLTLKQEGDGAELIKELRAMPANASVPIFVFSGFDEYSFRAYNLDDQIQRYFRKPASKSELVEAVREFTGIK